MLKQQLKKVMEKQLKMKFLILVYSGGVYVKSVVRFLLLIGQKFKPGDQIIKIDGKTVKKNSTQSA